MAETVEAQLPGWANPDLLLIAGIYVACGLWLIRLWRMRNRPEGRDHIARAVELGDTIFGVLAAVAFLGLWIFISLGRAAGRTHDRRW